MASGSSETLVPIFQTTQHPNSTCHLSTVLTALRNSNLTTLPTAK